MRYIRTYEGYGYKWENIIEKDGKLYIQVYELANEMEKYANKERETKKFSRGGYSIPDDDKIIIEYDDEYRRLIKKLLTGKVVTFSCVDCEETEHTGICEFVGIYPGIEAGDDDTFRTSHIQIDIENLEYSHNLEGDVIVHLDIDPEIYKNSSKYNL